LVLAFTLVANFPVAAVDELAAWTVPFHGHLTTTHFMAVASRLS
jgi:hypothetical protein